MLSLAAMQALVAVIEEGSFTRAAERLAATQSGVSQRIAKLERSLDVALLLRAPAGVMPTSAGQALYRKCVAILDDTARAEAAVRSYAGLTGTIRLGLMPALTRSLMGPVLRRYTARHPNVTINAVEAVSSDLIERVKLEELDVAIVPVFDAPPGLRCRAVGRSSEVLVSRGHRHPLHMKPVLLAKLGSMKLILQSAGNMRRERILGHLRARGIEISSLMNLDSMFGTLEYVEASDYMTVLPEIMVIPEIEHGSLCVRPIRDEGFALDMMAIQPTRHPQSSSIAALIDGFQAALEDRRPGYRPLKKRGSRSLLDRRSVTTSGS